MSFRELNLPVDLDTSVHDPVSELFVPLLKHSKRYDVAVGYFSTTWIRDAAEGVAHLAMNGGNARWVFSPELTKSDWAIIAESRSLESCQDFVNIVSSRNISRLIDELEANTREALAWLINDKIIEIKFAIPRQELSGMFHAKIGIFEDSDGNRVAFSGSYNLTGAANTNWEMLDVFSSLRLNDVTRLESKIDKFERIWRKDDPNLRVFDSTDEGLQPFKQIVQHSRRPYKVTRNHQLTSAPRIPSYFLDKDGQLKKHQEEAIKLWLRSEGRGILNMATGSGKTVTALGAAARLSQKIIDEGLTIFILIVVPYRHLAEQWRTEAAGFGFRPIMCSGDYPNWTASIGRALSSLSVGASRVELAIAVNDTFGGEKFQNVLNNVGKNFSFIADEMHNLGSKNFRKILPENATYRMGLSATPKRLYDDEGSKSLRTFFGDEVIYYGIADAIRDGTLSEYYYHPILVELTEKEIEEYMDLTGKLSRSYNSESNSFKDDSILQALLIKRSRLIAGASNKSKVLKSLLQERRDTNFNLIYVGDTSDSEERAVDAYTKMIGHDVGMRVRQFTSRENLDDRKEILAAFTSGELQAIVAIRCLDEGVDVPCIETAYITASSTNPRQFIQRRGRVLRKSEGKTFASIFDFIVVPPDLRQSDSVVQSAERSLVRREIMRVEEFAHTSINSGDSLKVLRPIRERFSLMDV